MSDLIVLAEPITPALVNDLDRAAGYARQDKSPNTRAAYQNDWKIFQAWCASRGVDALPATPEAVASFLASEADAGRKAATIGRRCAAIRYAHKLAGHEPPTNAEEVKATLRGIRRTIGAAPARKAPAIAETTRSMAGAPSAGLKGLRDQALLLLGFAGAFRRSELVALDVADLAQLSRLGRSTGYFRGAPAQKRESNQRRPLANRL